MDAVVTRIIEIERRCAAAVEQAEQDSARRIDERKRVLEEEKAAMRKQILAAENSRQIQTIEEAKRKVAAALTALKSERESLFQTPSLNEAVREDMLSILLGD